MKALLSISLIVSMLFQSFGYSIQAFQVLSTAREDISQVETPVSPADKLQETPLPDNPLVKEPTATLDKEPTSTPGDETKPPAEETATTNPAEEKVPTETPTSSGEGTTATSTPLDETLEPSLTPTSETTPTETATPLPDIDIDDTVEKAVVTREGAKITAFSKQLTITFPAKASEEALEISVKRPNPEEKGMEFDEQAFEITALGMDSKAEVSKFATPIKLEVQYDPEVFGTRDLVMTYYDEEQKEWLPLFSVTDPSTCTLEAWTNHFTIFNYDVEDYAAPGNIDVEGFQVASFTGAATYELPLELPDGPGGFKPDLTLRYNSQIVDMNRIRKQGAWVGTGWDLEVPYIGRNTYGTSDMESDDTFFQLLNQGFSATDEEIKSFVCQKIDTKG